MKKIGCGKYETTKVEAAKLPDPQNLIKTQEVKEVSCQKQEIKGIVKLQQLMDADGTTEDAV